MNTRQKHHQEVILTHKYSIFLFLVFIRVVQLPDEEIRNVWRLEGIGFLVFGLFSLSRGGSISGKRFRSMLRVKVGCRKNGFLQKSWTVAYFILG